MIPRTRIWWLVVVAATVLGCGGESGGKAEHDRRWLSDPAHGMVQTKDVGGLTISAQFVPVALLVAEEVRATGGDASLRDSLRTAYGGSVNFLLTFQGRDSASGPRADVAMQGAGSYDVYADRTMALNFDMKEQISLRTPGGTFRPVLALAESSYGFSTGRRLSIAFADPQGEIQQASSLDLVVRDIIFDTGIHHFAFDGEQLRAASSE